MLKFIATDNGQIAFSENRRLRFQINTSLTRKGLHQLRVDEYDAGGFHCGTPRFFQSTNSRLISVMADKLNGEDIDWDLSKVKELAEPKDFGPKPPAIIGR